MDILKTFDSGNFIALYTLNTVLTLIYSSPTALFLSTVLNDTSVTLIASS